MYSIRKSTTVIRNSKIYFCPKKDIKKPRKSSYTFLVDYSENSVCSRGTHTNLSLNGMQNTFERISEKDISCVLSDKCEITPIPKKDLDSTGSLKNVSNTLKNETMIFFLSNNIDLILQTRFFLSKQNNLFR